jgi:hypothetical protein
MRTFGSSILAPATLRVMTGTKCTLWRYEQDYARGGQNDVQEILDDTLADKYPVIVSLSISYIFVSFIELRY